LTYRHYSYNLDDDIEVKLEKLIPRWPVLEEVLEEALNVIIKLRNNEDGKVY